MAENRKTVYYFGRKLSNYVSNDERFIMTKVDGEENLIRLPLNRLRRLGIRLMTAITT